MTSRFEYPDTPTKAWKQAARTVAAGGVIGAVFNLMGAGAAAVVHFLTPLSQVVGMGQAMVMGGAALGALAAPLVLYATWPRYRGYNCQFGEPQQNTRSDLPLRYTFLAAATTAAASALITLSAYKLTTPAAPAAPAVTAHSAPQAARM